MSKEWKRVYDKDKLPTCIAIVGIFFSASTLLYAYDKIIIEVYLSILVVLAIFSYFYLTKKKRRKPSMLGGGGGMKTLEELVENH